MTPTKKKHHKETKELRTSDTVVKRAVRGPGTELTMHSG
jgi:hypothetical protein